MLLRDNAPTMDELIASGRTSEEDMKAFFAEWAEWGIVMSRTDNAVRLQMISNDGPTGEIRDVKLNDILGIMNSPHNKGGSHE